MRRRSKTGREPVKARRHKAAPPKRRNAPKAVRRRRPAAPGQEKKDTRLAFELNEARELQAASAEVLRVISTSPKNVQPVFDIIAESAVRLCQGRFSFVLRFDNDLLYFGACHGLTPEGLEAFRRELPRPAAEDTASGRSILHRAIAQIPDVLVDSTYVFVRLAQAVTYRSILAVPMLRDGHPIGTIAVARAQVGLFSTGQIALLQTFADQAVIAIENVRLFEAEQQRTRELNEALERQTATSEVLQVISSSPGDVEPVFATMLENAARICDAKFGNIFRWDGDALHLVATHNTPPAFAEARRRSPMRPRPDNLLSRMVATKTVIHVADYERLAIEQGVPEYVTGVELGGVRTALFVPMLKDNELIGYLSVYRQEVRPFTDKQIDLVKNFASQAVIAIENTRLMNELRESLQEQTATSEVLQVISSSPGDLQPVFEAMLEKAVRICDAKFGNIYRWDGDALHLVATRNTPPAFAAEARKRSQYRSDPKTVTGRMLETKAVVHIADLAAESAYIEERHPAFVAGVELGGVRTLLVVPMVKEDELVGGFTIYRQEVRPFTEKQIALVTNFAAQAVIAIENARLLSELHERTDQLAVQSQELAKLNQQLEQRVADQVGEIERMSRLRRFLPPQVADLIVASGTEKQLESHRREITALFCDLRGFTGFSEASAPEDVMTLLRDYHAAIGEIIIKYSGTLERYAGDGVMVVFNDPVPVDNPALRAVHMALETREAMGALTEKWRELGHDVGFGIGIAHGYATLGTIGFEGRFDYAAIGTVSNVASRLCHEAKPGQILISPRVFMAVKDAVTVEPVGEFTLKGIGRPLAAYNVLAAAPPNA